MLCCKGKKRKEYLDDKCTSEKYLSLKNKYVYTKGLSASVGFWGFQSFGLFPFTVKEIHLVLHVRDSMKLDSTLKKNNP